MARPKRCRRVCCLPKTNEFFPSNCTNPENAVVMTVEEYEAIRLMDYQNLTQEECGLLMNIARTTVQQIYNDSRNKIATAIVEGRPLRIEGGTYFLCEAGEAGGPCCGCGGGGCKRRNNMEE